MSDEAHAPKLGKVTCACGTCRTCYQRTYMREYRKKNPERIRQLVRESYHRHAAERCATVAGARSADPEKFRLKDKKQREKSPGMRGNRDPLKHSVHASVAQAIRSGRLVPRPCEECGESPITFDGRRGVHAHHEDYAKRLEVTWLCFRCHKKKHRKYVYPRKGTA